MEEVFQQASKEARDAADLDCAIELLAQCVMGEPGNVNYVRAFLENLHKKHPDKKSGSLARFKELHARSVLKKALAGQRWDEAIRHGLKVLAADPWSVAALTGMATAAVRSGDSDSCAVLSQGSHE